MENKTIIGSNSVVGFVEGEKEENSFHVGE